MVAFLCTFFVILGLPFCVILGLVPGISIPTEYSAA
jgi:hypothetical protein